MSAKSPAPRSVSGMPALTGSPSAVPVTDMMPERPCAIRSKPPFDAHGPDCPWPEIEA